MQEFSKQKKVQTLESHQHFSFLSFPKTNKNTNNLPSFFFVYFLFISVHHYLLATMHFMCKQRRATTIFLISIDAQLLGKERTNERFSGMLTDYGTPNEAFWGLSRHFVRLIFLAFGVFSANLSAPILLLLRPNIFKKQCSSSSFLLMVIIQV